LSFAEAALAVALAFQNQSRPERSERLNRRTAR
jgi:hypothetical protein